jgi:glucose-6-phosphate isomerase
MRKPMLDQTLQELETNRVIPRIWSKDPTVWRKPGQPTAEIADRLGWLTAPTMMMPRVKEILSFTEELLREGFTHAVLLGMGGSSLAPYVLARAFGAADGFPTLHMLDSTVPAAIRDCESRIDLARTLFIVASKSGGTIETLSLYKYFWARVAAVCARPGQQFIAITDPCSELETLARQQGFRATFLNPADIGGRYSALSLFGLVPASLIGLDINRLLRSAQQMAAKCSPAAPIDENPGAVLGAFMGAMARQGRNKLIVESSPQIGDFGLWAEQLIAESTGKEGKGILPVIADLETSRLATHGADTSVARLLFDTHSVADDPAEHDAPVFIRKVKEVYDLGAEFYCWEMATAVAGHLLGIHPFDQPNVAQAKRSTADVLAEYERTGVLPRIVPDWEQDGMSLTGIDVPTLSLADGMTTFLSSIQERDYCAVLAYVSPDGAWDSSLRALQEVIAAHCGVAVTVGYGPRYLHSTGQLHKGGPNIGHFIVLTADDVQDIPIPGERYTFAILKNAQALGDMQALQAAHRHVIHVHAGRALAAALKEVRHAIQVSADHTGDKCK